MNVQLFSSILDYPHPGLDSTVWSDDGKLLPEHKEFILSTLEKNLTESGFKDPSAWITETNLVGSLTTYQYLPKTDVDIHMVVDLDKFKKAEDHDVSDKEAFEILDAIRKSWSKKEIPLLPGTKHPLEFFFQTPLTHQDDSRIGVYNINTDKWTKEPFTVTSDFDIEELKPKFVEMANEMAAELDLALGEIRRDAIRIEELQAVVGEWPKEKRKAFETKINKKIEELDAEIEGVVKVREDLVEERHHLSNVESETEVKFKYLQKFGYLYILTQLMNLLKEDGGITEENIEEVKEIVENCEQKTASKDTKKLMIDFDDTIAENSPDNKIEDPMPGAKEALDALKAEGWTIVIYSVRANSKKGADDIRAYMKEHDLPFDELFIGKPHAEYYIDDRNIVFTSWKDVLNTIDKGSTHKEAALEIKYWVTPTGEFIPLEGHTHLSWIMNNFKDPRILGFTRSKINEHGEIYSQDANDIASSMIRADWVRVTTDDNDHQFGVEVYDLDSIPPVVDKVIDKFFDPKDGRPIMIESIGGGDVAEITDPFPSIQEAVNEDTRKLSLAPAASLKQAQHGVKYDYSSTQFNLPKDVTQKILEWSVENIPNEDLYDDETNRYGRELESHVTVLYGLTTNDASEVEKLLADEKPVRVKFLKTRHFNTETGDNVNIEVESEDLVKLNKKLSELDHESLHDEYHPHVSIAYVQDDLGHKYSDKEVLDDVEIELSTLKFSPKEGDPVFIELGKKKNKEAAFMPSITQAPDNPWQDDSDVEIPVDPDAADAEENWPNGEHADKPRNRSWIKQLLDWFGKDNAPQDKMATVPTEQQIDNNTHVKPRPDGAGVIIQVDDLELVPDSLNNWLAKNVNNGDFVTVQDKHGNEVTLRYPMKDIKRLIRFKLYAPEVHASLQLTAHSENEILQLIQSTGGATWNFSQGNLAGTKNYAISLYPERSVILDHEPSAEEIHAYTESNSDLLRKPENSFGAWFDNGSGKYYLDVVVTLPDRDEAIELGRQYNQKAIFDLQKFEEIPTGGTGEVQSKEASSDQEYWINPEGQVFDAPEGHERWILMNLGSADLPQSNFGVEGDIEETDISELKEIRREMFEQGWVRIGTPRSIGEIQLFVELESLSKIPQSVDDFLAEHFDPNSGKIIVVADQHDHSADITDPFPTLQKAIYKALRRQPSRAASLKTASISGSAWVDPNGKAYEFPVDLTHSGWIRQNTNLLHTKYKLKTDIRPTDSTYADKMIFTMLENGWVRVNGYQGSYDATEFSIQVDDLMNPPDALQAFLDQYYDWEKGDPVLMDDMNGNYAEVDITGDVRDDIRKGLRHDKVPQAVEGKEQHNTTWDEPRQDMEPFKPLPTTFEQSTNDENLNSRFPWRFMRRPNGPDYSDENEVNYMLMEPPISSKHANLQKEANTLSGVWVAPDGKFYDARSSGSRSHGEWVMKNAPLLAKTYGIADAKKRDYFDVAREMLEKGWARIGDTSRARGMIGVEVANIKNLPSYIDDALASFMQDGQPVMVADLNDNWAEVTWPFKSLQQEVRRTFNRRGMYKDAYALGDVNSEVYALWQKAFEEWKKRGIIDPSNQGNRPKLQDFVEEAKKNLEYYESQGLVAQKTASTYTDQEMEKITDEQHKEDLPDDTGPGNSYHDFPDSTTDYPKPRDTGHSKIFLDRLDNTNVPLPSYEVSWFMGTPRGDDTD